MNHDSIHESSLALRDTRHERRFLFLPYALFPRLSAPVPSLLPSGPRLPQTPSALPIHPVPLTSTYSLDLLITRCGWKGADVGRAFKTGGCSSHLVCRLIHTATTVLFAQGCVREGGVARTSIYQRAWRQRVQGTTCAMYRRLWFNLNKRAAGCRARESNMTPRAYIMRLGASSSYYRWRAASAVGSESRRRAVPSASRDRQATYAEFPSCLVSHGVCGRVVSSDEEGLARIIHECFCCNRGFAAATSLRRAGSPLAPSTYCSSTARGLAAPHARLATRLRDCAISRRTIMNNVG